MKNIDNNSDKTLEWKRTSKTELLRTPVLTVTQVESLSPQNETGKYIVLDATNWVIVVPVLGEDFLMVKQWRHGENALSIEFPGGVIDKGETPEQAAARELVEETGFVAKKITPLGFANPNPALMSNRVFVFLAEDMTDTGKQDLDADEFVHFMRIAQQEVFDGLGTPKYPHALMTMAAGLYMNHKAKTTPKS